MGEAGAVLGALLVSAGSDQSQPSPVVSGFIVDVGMSLPQAHLV